MPTVPPAGLHDAWAEPVVLIREARRRQRRRWLATGAAMLTVLAGVTAVIAASRAGTHFRPPSRPGSILVRHAPSALSGLPMPPSSDVQLLLDGRRPVWFSLATRQSEPIAGLPWNHDDYAFTRIVGGWSAQPYLAGPACLPTCAGPSLPNYFIANGSPRAARIAPGFGVAASNRSGAVWLTTFQRSGDNTNTTPARAQEVTTSGRPLGPQFWLPVGYLIEHAVGGDLLLSPDNQGPGPVTYKLWDPLARRVVRTFSDVIAAGPQAIAWGPICVHCPVHVLELGTGTIATVRLPRGSWAYNGTFSSDSRYLAFVLSTGTAPDCEPALSRIAVIDVTSGRLIGLPGSTVSGLTAARWSFGWQASTDRLIAVLPMSGEVIQVAYWAPGAARLRVATARIPHGTSAVLGEYA